MWGSDPIELVWLLVEMPNSSRPRALSAHSLRRPRDSGEVARQPGRKSSPKPNLLVGFGLDLGLLTSRL